jgi:hypothetical protein
MPEPTLTALEFPELLRVVQTYAVSDLGRIFLAALQPVSLLTDLPPPPDRFPRADHLAA